MGRKRTKHHDLPPRMQRKGNAYYYVCSAKPRRWEPLGTDLARAKRRWAELEADDAAILSVGDLVQRYLNRDERAANTEAQYKSYQKALAAAFPIPAAQLRSTHVALWRELQQRRKRYANGCIALLISSFKLGHELGLCELVTARRWKVADRDRVLLPAEFRAIRDKAPEWLQVMMDLGYLTSARPCDLLAMRWDRVTDESVLIRFKKTGQRQEVTMNDDLASVFARARQRPILGLYVVATERGRPVNDGVLNYRWRLAREAAGIEDAQFRDIRAMAADAAKRGGQDFQALLGHATEAQSRRYLKGRQTIIAEAVRKKL